MLLFHLKQCLFNDEDFSDVRHINLSNTKFWSGSSEVGTFTVNIEKYTKLKDLDISNSIVTSMSLSNASLASLNITNSSIEIINLVNQPFLDSIDLVDVKDWNLLLLILVKRLLN